MTGNGGSKRIFAYSIGNGSVGAGLANTPSQFLVGNDTSFGYASELIPYFLLKWSSCKLANEFVHSVRDQIELRRELLFGGVVH